MEPGFAQLIPVEHGMPSVDPESATVDTEGQVLQSPGLAGQVVDKLKLTSDPEFNPSVEEGEPVSAEAARRRAMSILLGHLTVEREGFSYAIRIESESDRTEERRVGNECVSSCRAWGSRIGKEKTNIAIYK